MALTRKMFFETLPRALDSDAYSVEGDRVRLVEGGKTLTITFAEQPTFKLGGFAVPRAEVTLCFEGFDDQETEAALKRFDRYFHRGGG
jgi:hypothetical protein